MIDRGSMLTQYQFTLPALDLAFFAATLRILMLVVVLAGSYWLVFGVLKHAGKAAGAPGDTVGAEK